MQAVRNFIRQGSPTVKVLMAISVTTVVVVAHRWVYAPFVKRRRYLRNEEWANTILEMEARQERGEPSDENYNLRY